MTTIAASFEGGSDGLAFTAANSNSGGDTPFTSRSGSTMNFSAAVGSAQTGSLSVAFNYNDTVTAEYVIYTYSPATITTRTAFRVWMYYPSGSGVQQVIIFRSGSSADIAYVGVNASGYLTFTDTSLVDQITSASTFPTDQWIMIQGAVTVGTTTSNGILELAYWTQVDTVTPAWSGTTATAANTGTTLLNAVRLGMALTPTVIHTAYFDDFAVTDTLSSGYLGPLVQTSGYSVAWLHV